MSLFGINNFEVVLIVFVVVLALEVLLVYILNRLYRRAKEKKQQRELHQKRIERLEALRAAKVQQEEDVTESVSAASVSAESMHEADVVERDSQSTAGADEKDLQSTAGADEKDPKPVVDIPVVDEPDLDPGGPEVVIDVDNVTMTFRTVNNSTSGIKDYVIQSAKGQLHHREFTALRNISFQVYKGEVVGVIGTNGSGKSTILKIVSGALRPTSGEVRVNRRKLQLLTLGTGFDGELTARENVYLNGSIIGYTKEFLDAHYDDIVEFAELQDFMEAKVKTFSSGMVSRLGFSIATAGEAAEILILDEILSVGDEFFRKKSLARIKEMIHGGSTVLLVSHSMPTIRNNCDRVVWIEKGDLKMVGDPKTVCDAYQKMNTPAGKTAEKKPKQPAEKKKEKATEKKVEKPAGQKAKKTAEKKNDSGNRQEKKDHEHT